MQTMDEIDRSFSAGYEQGAKDYKEQRDLVLQENAELVEKIEQLQKERDAAVADLKKAMPCRACKHLTDFEYCKRCYLENHWEWRGIDE